MINVVVSVIEKDEKEDAKREFIYVMKSFMLPKSEKSFLTEQDRRRGYEEGTTILWKTEEDVKKYLQVLRDGVDDRPFEMRWNILVVEKVFFGPYSNNEVIGWWRAEKQNNGFNLIELNKCPFPGDTWDNVCNFTIGT